MNYSDCDIKVVGIGGAGVNIVDKMDVEDMPGVQTIIMNSDQPSLRFARCRTKVQLGRFDGIPERADSAFGKAWAEECRSAIAAALAGARGAILVAGLSGSAGTGATPVVAQIARELGIIALTIAILPFSFEGGKRAAAAKQGLLALPGALVYQNELVVKADPSLSFALAMERANDEVREAIRIIIRSAGEKGISAEHAQDALVRAGFTWHGK